MSRRSSRVAKRSAGVSNSIETLEPRAYLNGVELGSPITSPLGGLSPTSISVTTASGANADFNGDGKTDLVVADETNSKVGLYLGNGDGTFQSPVIAAVQSNQGTVAVADMNGDGKLDIVTGGLGYVSIVHGDGAGGLGTATNIATNVGGAIAVVDLNGDGLMDIVASDMVARSSSGGATPLISTADSIVQPQVQSLIQQRDGSFVVQNISNTVIATSMVVGDFNGDSRPDLAFTIDLGGNLDPGAVAVMLNNGNGTFGAPAQYAVGTSPVSLVAADFNGDGKMDLAALNSGVIFSFGVSPAIAPPPVMTKTGGTISFLAGNGDGTFKSAVNSPINDAILDPPASMIVAQLNSSDALPDLLISVGETTASTQNVVPLDVGTIAPPQGVVMLNSGDGTFHLGTIVQTGGGPSPNVAAGELNTGDAFTDVVGADSNVLRSLLNVTSQDTIPPTASFATPSDPTPASPTDQFTVNFSDDKQVDLSTISGNSITVTGPDGTVLPAMLVATVISNYTVLATYQIAFAGEYYGRYTVTAATSGSAAVRDANGNALTSSTVGTFDVLLPGQPTFAPTITVSGQFSASAATGTKGPPVKVTVFSENGIDLPDLKDCVVTLAASPTSAFTSNSIILGQVERHMNAKAHTLTILFKNWNYPSTLGDYYIVANANGVLPPASSPNAISVQPATVSLQNLWNGATSNIVRHGKIDFSFQVRNNGTVIAKGILLADLVAASPGYGTISPMTQKVRVNIAPGQKRTIHLHVVPKAVPSGSYDLSLTLNPLTGFDGTSFTSNTVTATNSITL